MTRIVNASITLAAVAAASLPGTLAGYLVTLTPATPGAAPLTVTVPVDATSASFGAVPADSYVATIVAVDAAGSPLGPVVTGTPDPLVVTDVAVVTVNIPSALALSVA